MVESSDSEEEVREAVDLETKIEKERQVLKQQEQGLEEQFSDLHKFVVDPNHQ